jgi:hypothetical protein
MTKDILLAQILAQIPDCPHYLASAYLLEFMERLRSDGKQMLVDLTNITHQGYAADIPDNVLSVQKVYANGLEMGVGLSESDAVYLMFTYPATTTPKAGTSTITDELGISLTTELGTTIEIEA